MAPIRTAGSTLGLAAALSPAAGFVLGAVRAWHAGGRDSDLCRAFARAGLPASALVRLAAALGLVGAAGPLQIHPPGAAGLSPDEARLLVVLAALQAGEPWRAQRAIATCVPGPAVPRAIAALAAFAAALGAAGLRLPFAPLAALPLPDPPARLH